MKPLKLLFCFVISVHFTMASDLILKIKFNKNAEGIVYLMDYETQKIDTINFSNHSLHLYRKIESPSLFYLAIEGFNDMRRSMKFVLSNQTTEIEFDSLKKVAEEYGNDEGFDPFPNVPKYINDANQNVVFSNFQSNWLTFYKAIVKEERIKEREKIYLNFIEKSCQLIADHQNELVAVVVLDFLTDGKLLSIEKTQELVAGLNSQFTNLRIYESIKAEIGFESGAQAPDFEIITSNANHFKLSELKGKKVLLHFWSSSCAPCLKESPDILKFNKLAKSKGIVFINISQDLEKDRWLKGIAKGQFGTLNNYCDFKAKEGDVAKVYEIHSIPAYYLIDEQGKILVKKTNIVDIEKFLKGI